jgi:DNA-directed RNA polymerase subunit RPC12/RpoP
MMILNEEKFAKELLTGQNDSIKSIRQKIDLIARYNYHVMNKKADESYTSIVKWLEKHHEIFSEQTYSNVISDCIKKAAKRPFYHIEGIKITKKEIETITSRENLRHEKILFVLLCMAKQQKVAYGFDNGLVSYKITDLFKAARVSVPVDERENILHELLKAGLIGLPMKNDTRCLFVKFVDESDDVALELSEQDCGELAYAYLHHTGKANVFRCSKCGKLIKQSKKYGDICKGCQGGAPEMKLRWCVDCGNEFLVNTMNTKTCRCETCQRSRDTELNRIASRERMQKYRASI